MKNDIDSNGPNLVYNYRTRAHLTQSDLARELGVSVNTIYNYEQEGVASPDRLLQLLTLFVQRGIITDYETAVDFWRRVRRQAFPIPKEVEQLFEQPTPDVPRQEAAVAKTLREAVEGDEQQSNQMKLVNEPKPAPVPSGPSTTGIPRIALTRTRMIVVFVLFVVAISGFIIRQQCPQSCVPREIEGVTLYEHVRFCGKYKTFRHNVDDLRNYPPLNDTASSVSIRGPYIVAVCEHIRYRGECEEFSADDPDFSDNLIGTISASSLIITDTRIQKTP